MIRYNFFSYIWSSKPFFINVLKYIYLCTYFISKYTGLVTKGACGTRQMRIIQNTYIRGTGITTYSLLLPETRDCFSRERGYSSLWTFVTSELLLVRSRTWIHFYRGKKSFTNFPFALTWVYFEWGIPKAILHSPFFGRYRQSLSVSARTSF